MEAEAEAVDGRLEEAEAEAKEKLTTVPSLVVIHWVIKETIIKQERTIQMKILFFTFPELSHHAVLGQVSKCVWGQFKYSAGLTTWLLG